MGGKRMQVTAEQKAEMFSSYYTVDPQKPMVTWKDVLEKLQAIDPRVKNKMAQRW